MNVAVSLEAAHFWLQQLGFESSLKNRVKNYFEFERKTISICELTFILIHLSISGSEVTHSVILLTGHSLTASIESRARPR
jgi:hypothetical protein